MEAGYIGFGVGCIVVGVAGLIMAIVYLTKGKVWGPSATLCLAVGAIAAGVLALFSEGGWAIFAFVTGFVIFIGIVITSIVVAGTQRT